jgi:hypothetical protein
MQSQLLVKPRHRKSTQLLLHQNFLSQNFLSQH